MEVRIIKTNEVPGCPFSGSGTVVVLETSDQMAHLMYPPTLETWTMPIRDHLNQQNVVDREGFVNSTEDCDQLWPTNLTPYKFEPEKLAQVIRREVQRRYLYQLPIPCGRDWVVKVLSVLLNWSEEETDKDLRRLYESTKPIPRYKAPKIEQAKFAGTPGKEVTMAKKKVSSSHRQGVLYLATPKLDPEKFKGQCKLVAKALGSYSTMKDLDTIVKKCESNGEYKVNADGGITDSVHFHLRELVKEGVVKEQKIEVEKEAPAPKATKKGPKVVEKAAAEETEEKEAEVGA